MTDLRDRLFDRIGVPRDCGWTDDQIMELIDSGLSGNTPTAPAGDDYTDDVRAAVTDIAWALNCHGLDALVGMHDDLLARHLYDHVESLGRAQRAVADRQAS